MYSWSSFRFCHTHLLLQKPISRACKQTVIEWMHSRNAKTDTWDETPLQMIQSCSHFVGFRLWEVSGSGSKPMVETWLIFSNIPFVIKVWSWPSVIEMEDSTNRSVGSYVVSKGFWVLGLLLTSGYQKRIWRTFLTSQDQKFSEVT